MTKLSIIIPVYNAEKYLEETIKRLIEEKSNDIEFIFINDGSKDNSISILNKYKNIDKRIKVFSKENGGVSNTRNFGIKHVNSEYIMFVDSDDLVEPDYYQNIVQDLNKEYKKKNDKYDFIIYTKNYDNRKYNNRNILEGMYDLDYYFNTLYLRSIWSKVYRKDFLIKNKISFIENLTSGEDMLFNTNVLINNPKIKLVDKQIYNYRITPNSLSQTFDINHHIDFRNNLLKFRTNIVPDFDYLVERHDLYGIIYMINKIVDSREGNKYKAIKNLLKEDWARSSLDNYSKHEFTFKYKIEFILIKLKLFRILILILSINKKRKRERKSYFEKI